MAAKKKQVVEDVVVAQRFINDAQAVPPHSYRPGDVIEGWDEDRVERAVNGGIVVIEQRVPVVEVGPSEIEVVGPKEVKEEK